MYVLIILLSIIVNFISCRDFYVGMFKKNDILVAQDQLYKEKVYHRTVYAKYARTFKCPITYFRVADRLGVGRGPKVIILNGGLRKAYIVLSLMSVYNYPISVNIYVGCENKMARVQTPFTTSHTKKNTETTIIKVKTTEVAHTTTNNIEENTETTITKVTSSVVDEDDNTVTENITSNKS